MSDIVHHSDAPDGVIPKRYTCRRKVKSSPWTKVPSLVDCPQCLAMLNGLKRQARRAADAILRLKEPS